MTGLREPETSRIRWLSQSKLTRTKGPKCQLLFNLLLQCLQGDHQLVTWPKLVLLHRPNQLLTTLIIEEEEEEVVEQQDQLTVEHLPVQTQSVGEPL